MDSFEGVAYLVQAMDPCACQAVSFPYRSASMARPRAARACLSRSGRGHNGGGGSSGPVPAETRRSRQIRPFIAGALNGRWPDHAGSAASVACGMGWIWRQFIACIIPMLTMNWSTTIPTRKLVPLMSSSTLFTTRRRQKRPGGRHAGVVQRSRRTSEDTQGPGWIGIARRAIPDRREKRRNCHEEGVCCVGI